MIFNRTLYVLITAWHGRFLCFFLLKRKEKKRRSSEINLKNYKLNKCCLNAWKSMTDVKHINAYISLNILIFDRNSGRDIYNTHETFFKKIID